MNIAIIGTGYVGLVSGACYADSGNSVICVDIDEEKVGRLKQGQITIYEPGLEPIFLRNLKEKRLEFTTDLEYAVSNSEIICLALPTPPGSDGAADLSYIVSVAEEMRDHISEYKIIIHKSTVPVGTADRVTQILSDKVDPSLFDVVSNPEFLREGAAVEDFTKPDRVIVGTGSQRARDAMTRLYSPFLRQGNHMIFMDQRSAEVTKYAANAYLASRISFMNEIANICERVGADIDFVREGLGSDSRIGKRFLFAGIGYGGSCFPKDISALDKTAQDHEYNFKILKAVMEVNRMQREFMIQKVRSYYQGGLTDLRMAIWGLSFKPNTDDIREAPAVYIIQELLKEGVQISVYDPQALENGKSQFGSEISYYDDQYDVLEGADCLLIMTEWSVFRTPDFKRMKRMLKKPVIFDGRNLYSLQIMASEGFRYESIGREIVEPAKSQNQ